MTSDKVELMLETLTRAQNRLVTYLTIGFICGFTLGVVASWLMFSIAR
jgi:hypothetical protein